MKKILAGALLALICAHDAVIQAARTFSGAATDRVVMSAYTTNHTTTTWSIWTYRTGDGGNGFGRMWSKTDGTNHDNRAYTSSTKYFFERDSSTADGVWAATRPSASVWHHIAITYDSGSLSNDPVIYFDGTSQSLTDDTNPTGTITNNSVSYVVGNKLNGADSNWGGSLGDFAVWSVILSANEITALARGVRPINIRLASLQMYAPITGLHTTEPDFSSASTKSAGTVTGTALTAHNPPVQGLFFDYTGSHPDSVAASGSAVPMLFRRRR